MPIASYKGLGSGLLRAESIGAVSTLYTLTQDQQGVLLFVGETTAASRIRLPAPAAGMQYTIIFSSQGVSSATKITSSGVYDILTAATTANGVANETTAERGQIIQLTAINDFRWVAARLGASTLNINSTST